MLLLDIFVAKSAGFCFGVNRAVTAVSGLLKRDKKVCTLGEIIHNPQIVKQFEKSGVRIVSSPSEVSDGETLVVRSHGVAQEVYRQIEKMGISCYDATCPFVAKIHQIVSGYSGPDQVILIAGDSGHPEVRGIAGHCFIPYFIFKTAQELEDIIHNVPDITQKSFVLIAQTTFNTKEWGKCVENAKKLCTNLTVFDTICNATSKRQSEALALSQKVDLMIVVGGRHSSNTAKLKEICEPYCKTVLVESADELDSFDFGDARIFGITAGASTPACIIKEVHFKMSEMVNKNLDDENFSFEEALEQSLKRTYTGQRVTGIVTSVAPNEIQVDIGTKHAGFVPLDELTEDTTAKAEDLVKKGDQLELMVLKVNDQEGTVTLSKKKLDAVAGFEAVEKACEDGSVLTGTVVEVIKGGVLAVTNNVRVFIPASQATARREDDLSSLLRKTVEFKILEVNNNRKRAVGSIRAVLNEKRREQQEKFWAEVEVGKTYKGEVKSLTSYGAFVDLGGVDGMVHISELSWGKIKHPSEVVKVGDIVEVYVKDIDAENKKISLGYKKSEDNPWEVIKGKYSPGDVCKVKIVSLTAFGAFAEVIPGIDGLIHISQISDKRINKPSDALSVGQEVDVKITDIDYENKRVSLSVKALLEPAEAPAEETAE